MIKVNFILMIMHSFYFLFFSCGIQHIIIRQYVFEINGIFFFSFSYQFLLNEISIIWRAFSLPVLEPLTPQRLEKIISITLTCLYTSVTVAMSNTVISLTNPQPTKPSTTKDEEIDNYGNCIVQKSVSLWSICMQY